MKTYMTLAEFLASEGGDDDGVHSVVASIAHACAQISKVVASGAISDSLGLAGRTNVQDEEQKKLDVITNDMMRSELKANLSVAGLASEELDTIETTGRAKGLLVVFDPLDGSSNIDVNVSVGTIFSVLPGPADRAPAEADFFQSGRRQLAAGYAVYGPQTMLVLTVREAVVAFTLDAGGVWLLTHEHLNIPVETREFAINMSNQRHWAAPIQKYVQGCIDGKSGPRGKDFNMRWVASMVADVHRILMRGGIFLYPWDAREPGRAGKLRLLYEANPMALIVTRAGGQATDGQDPILDIQPSALHQRVPVVLGSANEVHRVSGAETISPNA